MNTKRILAAASAIAVASLTINAQNVNDALKFSVNEYEGTARTTAMGNAFTALGGDLGSIGINPAGSAVNSYSQYTLTPSVSIATTKATFSGGGETSSNNASQTRVTLPNIGVIMNVSTGRTYGLKSFSFGMVSNATANYNDYFDAYGYNTQNSLTGAFASSADRISASSLSSDDWSVDYNSGLIGQYGTYSDGTPAYIGAGENLYTDGIGIPRTLDQEFIRQRRGYKHDLVLNWGGNINDKLYLGVNLGLLTFSYNTYSYMAESVDASIDPDTEDNMVYYYDTHYRTGKYAYEARLEGSGIYGKIGVIYLPTPSLRIGAAVQTPSSIVIDGVEWCEAEARFADSSYDGYASSGDYEFGYRLRTPWRFNVGAAYTFGGKFLVSADYEFTDFSTMKFRERGGDYASSDYTEINNDILDYTGIAHQVRLGAEYRVTPSVSLRAGYNLLTSPEYSNTNGSKSSISANTNIISFGGGYSSKGSFFCDLAVRGKFLPTEYYYPYGTDIYPECELKSSLWNVTATFGWRF